jgi:hypothetical protein
MNLKRIEKRKQAVLAENGLLQYLPKLKQYKLVDELHDMREGSYVRWIHLDRRKLTNGAFLVRVDIRDDGIYLLMRNAYHRLFSVWADECLIFQKIMAEEVVLLRAMNHIY